MDKQPIPLKPAMTPGVTVMQATPVSDPNMTFAIDPAALAQEVSAATNNVKAHFKQPVFWWHFLMQALAWFAYSDTGSTPLKFGTLTFSLGSFFLYVWHAIYDAYTQKMK